MFCLVLAMPSWCCLSYLCTKIGCTRQNIQASLMIMPSLALSLHPQTAISMEDKKIIDRLLQDEVVQYISLRHHVTAKEVLDCFMTRESEKSDAVVQHPPVEMEDNEVQIIRDLIQLYH